MIGKTGLPNITYIDTFIEDGHKSVISLRNFYETMLVGDIDDRDHIFRIPVYDFFIKYRQELSECIQYYNLPESFFYRPKSLSLELYDTTEMWLAILRLNGMKSIIEFNQGLIKVYNPHDVKELINIFFKREGVIS